MDTPKNSVRPDNGGEPAIEAELKQQLDSPVMSPQRCKKKSPWIQFETANHEENEPAIKEDFAPEANEENVALGSVRWMLILRVDSKVYDHHRRAEIEQLLKLARQQGLKVERADLLTPRAEVHLPPRKETLERAHRLKQLSEKSRLAGQETMQRLRAKLSRNHR